MSLLYLSVGATMLKPALMTLWDFGFPLFSPEGEVMDV